MKTTNGTIIKAAGKDQNLKHGTQKSGLGQQHKQGQNDPSRKQTGWDDQSRKNPSQGGQR